MSRTRSLELWHIPKRNNIHQLIGAVELLSDKRFNGKSWTDQKKETFNTKLGQAGLTESGKVLSQSALRTFVALLKYLGFIYVNSESPTQTIHVTKAGFELIKKHPSVLKLKKNLRDVSSNKLEILESDVLGSQMVKLQLTNPTVRQDCSNILLFPFRTTLSILKVLGHVSKVELGYIIFSMKNVDELNKTIEKIKNFRAQQEDRRNKEIESFKKTEIGNLTLVQAPTAAYYIGLCVGTGLCERFEDKLYLKRDMEPVVDSILSKYRDIDPFDFGENSRLWIEYYGDTSRLYPPKLSSIVLKPLDSFLVKVLSVDGQLIGMKVISKDDSEFTFPFFRGEIYRFEFYSLADAKKVYEELHIVNSDKLVFNLPEINNSPIVWDLKSTAQKIMELINCTTLDSVFANEVATVAIITKKEFNLKLLRGARLEFLFYKLLTILKDNKRIDDVVWNGTLNGLQIPHPAPGGKEGKPDIYFIVKNKVYVLELTTIKSPAAQWSAEGASVPEHIMNFARTNEKYKKYKIIGLFAAPIIAPRIKNMFKRISQEEKIPHIPIPIDQLLKIFLEDRQLP